MSTISELYAFPHEDRAKEWERAGMTLRDYLAAKAMQGILANPITAIRNNVWKRP